MLVLIFDWINIDMFQARLFVSLSHFNNGNLFMYIVLYVYVGSVHVLYIIELLNITHDFLVNSIIEIRYKTN